jgi:hypothetical protein
MASLDQVLFPALGSAVAVAGADKITGDSGYMRMFRHLGWSRGGMRAVAGAEMLAGALMALRGTRGLGGAILAATSTAVLVSELKHGRTRLAAPRAMVLVGALAAVAMAARPRRAH